MNIEVPVPLLDERRHRFARHARHLSHARNPTRNPYMNSYSSLCDDFGVYVYVNTKMELPTKRETVLHFFDSLQKTFPQMTDFDIRDTGEYVLEEDREKGSYRWVSMETRRMCSGYVNPPSLEDADAHH